MIIKEAAMVLKKKKTFKNTLSFLIGVSLCLTFFSTGLKAVTPMESSSQDSLDDACIWMDSLSVLVNLNNLVNADGINLWLNFTTQGDETTKKTKTEKGRVKEHRNSTSKKPVIKED
jgi:hypothetical protein